MTEPAREPDYATKADIDVLRAETAAGFAELRGEIGVVQGEIGTVRGEIDVLRAEIRAEMAGLEARLMQRMSLLEVRTMRTLYAVAAAMLAGQVAAVLTLVRLLG